jgi:hypothetical protein
MGCNPNMIDSLFTPRRCILHITKIGETVRENRKLFLSKKSWHTFKGYSYSQIKKAKSKEATGKRSELVKKYGYDVKFAYHCVRLMNEVEQIMEEGDLDLERNREQLKSIRRGEWTIEQIEQYFARKELDLETLYRKSDLPYEPRESQIKDLLVSCLESAMDGVSEAVNLPDRSLAALKEIRKITEKFDLGA